MYPPRKRTVPNRDFPSRIVIPHGDRIQLGLKPRGVCPKEDQAAT